MRKRIQVAKQSIENDKARAAQHGREYRQFFSPISFTDDAIAVFERLACNPNMEPVWKVLSKLFDDAKRPPDTWQFADFCYQNLGIWKHSPRRTPAEHARHFGQIAEDVMNVAARIVVEPEFGMIGQLAASVSSVEMVTDKDLEWLIETMDASLVDGYYIESDEDAIRYLRSSLHDVIPDLYRYAEWIAANAKRIAAQAPISERPNRGTAQRTFFVKHLSKWFREKFKIPMHEVVAGVASALFDEEVTADTVQKAVQRSGEVSIPFRRGKLPLPR